MNFYNNCSLLFLSSLLIGCASHEVYYWGDYEGTLYQRYVQSDYAQTEAELRTIISDASQQHQRVAPGIYADYGFLLYKRGDKAGATQAFNTESSLYPESKILMNKLVEKIQNLGKSTPTKEEH